MPRAGTPSFIAEFALHTTPADDSALDKRLDAARNLYNASLGESLRRLRPDARERGLAVRLRRPH